MPWIQNLSRSEVSRGSHRDPGANSMLIQISDPPGDHPTPQYAHFKEIHQFDFLDIEEDGITNFGSGEFVDVSEVAITQDQATKLVKLLQHALAQDMNVIVHCHAGVCRSGAVCEIGVMIGFQDLEDFRVPNLLVKHKMLRGLGWAYDSEENHAINGVPIPDDWVNDNEKVFILAEARRKRREQDNGS
jgi:predicted protein tyrosine phosphatase